MSGGKPLDLASLDARLPGRIAEILNAARVPGAAIAVVRGEDAYIATFGAKRTGASDPVTAATAFDIGSCAKSYVATAIAVLVSAGKLSFDDPVRRYVPEFEVDDPWISANATIRDLLANRLGLARQRPIEAFPAPHITLAEILRRLKHLRRAYPFRAGYVYFNLGFMICAEIVARVSGMPYAQFMEERLFRPLGMTDSQSGGRAFARIPDRAVGHTASTGTVTAIPEQEFDVVQGAGCIHSSAADALQWLRFHLGLIENDSIANPAHIRELHRAHTIMPPEETGLMHRVPEAVQTCYGLGWWQSDFNANRLVQHAGGMFGWRAQTSLMPGKGVGVAVYLNIAANVHSAIAYLIHETILTGAPRNWGAVAQTHQRRVAEELTAMMARYVPAERGAPASLPLAAFEGVYTHPAAGEIEIVRDDGDGLLMKQLDGRLWDFALRHYGGDVFEATFADPAVRDYLPVPGRTRFTVKDGVAVAFEEPGTRYARRS